MIKDSDFLQKTNISSSDQSDKKLPDYDETFGHIAEDIIRDSIGKRAGLFVEKVEKGTKVEDQRRKVDFWVKFAGIEEPLGIQYTVSSNENKIREKKEFLRSINFIAKKEKRPDAEINWSGKANLVLVRGNKIKMARLLEESQKKNVKPSKLIGDEFIRGFFSQIMIELDEVNPFKKKIISEAIQAAYRKKAGIKNKRAGNI